VLLVQFVVASIIIVIILKYSNIGSRPIEDHTKDDTISKDKDKETQRQYNNPTIFPSQTSGL